jgi:hypothetical protein
MRTRSMFAAVPALLLCIAGARADVYDFSYVGVNDPSVYGSGTFTTGTPYGDGYAPIISITGTTEAGAITGLDTSDGTGIDPSNGYLECCYIGPMTSGGAPDFFIYDNAYAPNSANPFSSSGLLFDVSGGTGPTGYPLSPVNLFGDGNGNTYELNYGENTPADTPPAYGGTQIIFTAGVVPEPRFYGMVALCLSGLLFARWRRRKASVDK